MTLYLIPLAWLIYGLLGPVILSGERNRHNAAFVWLRKETAGQHQPSIRVQEVGEWRFGKLVGFAAGMLAAWLMPDIPPAPIFVAILTVLPDTLTRVIKQVDWAGHGAEVMNAEAEGIAGYREAEAARVARDYDASTEQALEWFEQMHWLSCILYTLARW